MAPDHGITAKCVSCGAEIDLACCISELITERCNCGKKMLEAFGISQDNEENFLEIAREGSNVAVAWIIARINVIVRLQPKHALS